MSEEKLIEFDCPMCHVKIPIEWMAKKTKYVDFKGHDLLVCIGCGEEYEKMVAIAMERRIAENYAAQSDLKAETILAIRKEQQEVQAEDERLVDEEVDVMDGAKMKKVFKKAGHSDLHEDSKTPLQIMREKFRKGLEKTAQRRIILPVGVKLKGGLT